MPLHSAYERCRICLKKTGSHVSLHKKVQVGEDDVLMSKILINCGNVEISHDDRKPQNACFTCIENAKVSYSFKMMCMQSETTLNTEILNKMINRYVPLGIIKEDDITEVHDEEIRNIKEEEEEERNAEELEESIDCFDNFDSTDHQESSDYQEKSNNVDVRNLGRTKKNRHNCPECDKSFKYRCHLMRHSLSHKVKKCRYCEFRAAGTELGMHMHKNHDDKKNLQCPNCDKRFFHKQNLSIHMVTHTGVKKHVCEVCGKGFSIRSNMTVHRERHTAGKLHKCDTCENAYVELSSLRRHKMAVHMNSLDIKKENTGEKLHKCDTCGNAYAQLSSLRRHKNIAHTDDVKDEQIDNLNRMRQFRSHKMKKCRYCEFRAAGSELGMHMQKMHDDKKKLKCTDCDKRFFCRQNFRKHRLTHTSDKKCEVCGLSISANQNVHRKCFAGEKLYKCNICENEYVLRSSLRRHKIKAHINDVIKEQQNLNNSEKQEGEIKRSVGVEKKCPYCDFQATGLLLSKHMDSNHEDRKTIQCPDCDKRFFHEKTLKSHLVTHTGVKNHICEVCGRRFALRSNLTSHRKCHTNEKPYKCDTCGMTFVHQGGLRSHKITHMIGPQVACKLCGEAFKRRPSLRRHMLMHTGERPHPCPLCAKRFKTKDEQKRHMDVHTKQLVFKCDVCSKEFHRKFTLQVHKRMHTGERPHVCEVCGKTFTQAHCLRSHKASFHPDM